MTRITPHYKTGTVVRFEKATPQGMLVHEVSTTTRHTGFDVATTLAGFVDPRSIQTFRDKEEAVAEARRRANGEESGPPALTKDQQAIVSMLTDPDARRRTIDDLGAYWQYLFNNGQHDDADQLASLLTALRDKE